ncbi:putative AC transposase [Bienertia sinuspersici]
MDTPSSKENEPLTKIATTNASNELGNEGVVDGDGDRGVLGIHGRELTSVVWQHFDQLIPISTVASESSFSTGGRIIGPHRSRLRPEIVEALTCLQSWRCRQFKDVANGKDFECASIYEDEDVEVCFGYGSLNLGLMLDPLVLRLEQWPLKK